MRASVLQRPTLGTGAVLLLFIPLVAGLHHEEVDHDGATQHLEAPHEGHDFVAAATGDRIPTTGLQLSADAAAGSAVPLESRSTVGAEDMLSEDHDPEARAPPGSPRSRAPPFLI
jgi:hypothetical protein